jgi:two-component sensor histidine kinase
MPISTRLVATATFAFLAIGFLALFGIVGTTVWLGERAQVYFEQVIEARDTRGAAVELRNAVLTAESSQRGFIVTGNEIYLAPYNTAKAQAHRHVGELKSLLTPYPESAVPLERLTTIVDEKFGEMDVTISLKRARQDAEALAAFQTNRGKTLMDEANIFFTGVIRQADGRLTAGVAEHRANASWLRVVSALGAIVIVAVVGGAAFVLWRYTRELKAARDTVAGLNEELEGRVAERTSDLARSRDRAELLLREVNHRVSNSLALVSSLVNLQARSLGDLAAKSALAEAQDRIFAISLVHRSLYSSGDVRTVTLDEYLEGLLEHLRSSLRSEGQGAQLSYRLEPLKLATDTSVNLGVIVTEWVTNAFKYAYPDGQGEIRVQLGRNDHGAAELVVEDDGVGRTEGAAPKGTGLGSRIVTAMAGSMGAAVRYEAANPGMRARLTFPIEANVQQTV